MTGQEAERLVDSIAGRLGEHFDACQILVSWNEDGLTKCTARGSGNWYARQGMAHEFINHDIAQEAAQQIAEKLNEKPDAGEDWQGAHTP